MNLIIATRNDHKAREIQQILGQEIKVLTLKNVGFEQEIIEDGDTFEKNAEIKIVELRKFFETDSRGIQVAQNLKDIILLADDSGLEVDYLGGDPGVRSARYAGEPSDDANNTRKLLMKLEGVPAGKRTARFRCVIASACLSTRQVIQYFDGVCEGKIGFKSKGGLGFGYDPVFFPEGSCRTFAELSAEEKNKISHRSKAMVKFKEWIFHQNI